MQVGCNYQTGNWVFGIQGDYDWVGATSSTTTDIHSLCCLPLRESARFPLLPRSNSLASVTGRVGYSWGRVLGYVKGGGAWVKTRTRFRGPS